MRSPRWCGEVVLIARTVIATGRRRTTVSGQVLVNGRCTSTRSPTRRARSAVRARPPSTCACAVARAASSRWRAKWNGLRSVGSAWSSGAMPWRAPAADRDERAVERDHARRGSRRSPGAHRVPEQHVGGEVEERALGCAVPQRGADTHGPLAPGMRVAQAMERRRARGGSPTAACARRGGAATPRPRRCGRRRCRRAGGGARGPPPARPASRDGIGQRGEVGGRGAVAVHAAAQLDHHAAVPAVQRVRRARGARR